MRLSENDLSFGESLGLGEYPVANGGAGALIKVIGIPDQLPVQGATVVLYKPNGEAYDSDVTDAAGRAIVYGSPPTFGTAVWTAKIASLPPRYVPTSVPGSIQIAIPYSASTHNADRVSDRAAVDVYKDPTMKRYYEVSAEVMGYKEELAREQAVRDAAARAAEESAAAAAHDEMIRQETRAWTVDPTSQEAVLVPPPVVTRAPVSVETANAAGVDWTPYILIGGGVAAVGLVVYLALRK